MSAPQSLVIEVPSEIPEGTEPYWEVVRRCNGSREAMIDFICGIGGYRTGCCGGSAIEFNVKVYRTNFDAEHLWALDVDQPMLSRRARQLFEAELDRCDGDLWDLAAQGAWEGWSGSDMPYETWLGERVEWKFGLVSGHLCMYECEGIDLRCSPNQLRDQLTEFREDHDEGGAYTVSDEQLRKLFIICVQNSVEITPNKVTAAVEYEAAWIVWQRVQPKFERELEQIARGGEMDELKHMYLLMPEQRYRNRLANLANLAGLEHPLPINHKIVSIDGEMDEDDGQERLTGPLAEGRVARVNVYHSRWSYTVQFSNGTTVEIDEIDLITGGYTW